MMATYGADPFHDAGTDGQAFVDRVNGSDANNGLTPASAKATIAAGYAVVRNLPGTRTIRVMGDGVKYRGSGLAFGSFDLRPIVAPTAAAGIIRLAAYGTDRPILTGGIQITGFTQCTAADAPLLGPNFASIHKATVPKAAIRHTAYHALIPTENDEPLMLAQRRREMTDLFFLDQIKSFYDSSLGDSCTWSTSGNTITGLAHPAIMGAYTDAQLAKAVVSAHVYANFTKILPVVSAAGGVLTLSNPESRRPSTTGVTKYSLLNILPEMQAGGWGYTDDGSAITLYVWPRDVASLAGGIEIAAGLQVLEVRSDANRQVEIEGFIFQHASGPGESGSGIFINTATHCRISQCTFRNLANADFGPGAVYAKASNSELADCTIRNMQCSYGAGYWVKSAGTANPGSDASYNRLRRLLIENFSLGWMRTSAQSWFAAHDIMPLNGGRGSHGNQWNFYGSGQKCVLARVWNDPVPGRGMQAGYGTYEGHSDILLLNCLFRMSESGRAVWDQSDPGVVPPANPSLNYMINCWVPHETDRLITYNGMGLGFKHQNVEWDVYNTIAPSTKARTSDSQTAVVRRHNNIVTNPGLLSSSETDPSETQIANLALLHADPGNGDYRPVEGSPILTKQGYDVSTIIAQFEAWFPDVAFRRDAHGRAWDPADPGMGPLGKRWAGQSLA